MPDSQLDDLEVRSKLGQDSVTGMHYFNAISVCSRLFDHMTHRPTLRLRLLLLLALAVGTATTAPGATGQPGATTGSAA